MCLSSSPFAVSRPVLTFACLAGLLSSAGAALVFNGLLVDLKATNWSGTGNWNNTGSLGGSFTPDGNPTKATAKGVNGVFFDGVDAFKGVASPAGVTGTGDRSVEVWVYQAAVGGEETLVAWGKRGGGDGTNNSLNWGTNATFGAFGGWGAGPDQGYGALAPTKAQWNLVTMTVNSAGDKSIYVNGALATSEPAATNGPALNTHAGLDFLIGAQQNAAAVPGTTSIDGGNKLQGGVVGAVRIHDGVLSAADVLNNFNEEKGTYQLAAAPKSPLSKAPTHRWNFNEASGTSFADSGTAGSGATAAALKGAGAALTGTGVNLPGGSSATQAYIDLPNGVASGKDISAGGYAAVTYEVFSTVDRINNTDPSLPWSRVVDFGTSSAGEVTAPGGSFNGSAANGGSYIALTNSTGNDPNMLLERNNTTGAGNRSAAEATQLGTERHIVITYDPSDSMWKWYLNGNLMEGFSSDAGPSSLNDVNNWLGRSNFSGDANTDGTYNEFRIFDYSLTDAQIQQNFLDGPNKLTLVPEPSGGILALTALALGMHRRKRRAGC